MIEAKSCTGCGEVKSLDGFQRHAHTRDGYYGRCKSCRNLQAKQAYAEGRYRRKRCRDADDKRRRSERQRFRLYGVTPDQVAAMRVAQDGKCAICSTDDPKGRGDFHVDHCHETGRVRGLLCSACNTALGAFERWYLPRKEVVDVYRAP